MNNRRGGRTVIQRASPTTGEMPPVVGLSEGTLFSSGRGCATAVASVHDTELEGRQWDEVAVSHPAITDRSIIVKDVDKGICWSFR